MISALSSVARFHKTDTRASTSTSDSGDRVVCQSTQHNLDATDKCDIMHVVQGQAHKGGVEHSSVGSENTWRTAREQASLEKRHREQRTGGKKATKSLGRALCDQEPAVKRKAPADVWSGPRFHGNKPSAHTGAECDPGSSTIHEFISVFPENPKSTTKRALRLSAIWRCTLRMIRRSSVTRDHPKS